uniref:Outer-membrane lipoprotein carrier protein n=1 Tax=Magnetococcus massalia (strain MO-1) TaxID=451514 RepID=A0A1S7LHY6_MAGMO|nr:Outer membrane lipoprotein carrier protein LolA [Candidatus Magnetococcus massalia]
MVALTGRFLSLLLFGLCFTLPLQAAEDVSADHPAVVRLQQFVDGIRTFEADFEQQIIGNGRSEVEKSHGHFVALRPGRFRWDYKSPEVQNIVSDGRTIWIYEPELEQATRISAARLDRAPAAFLVSKTRLDKIFTMQVGKHQVLGLEQVYLLPKEKEAHFKSLIITLNRTGDGIASFEVEDTLGNRSLFRFIAMKLNGSVDTEQFTFTPPEGIDIIDG